MHKVHIVSEKYDGTPRDSYDGQLLDHTQSVARVKVPAGTPVYEAKHDRVVNSEDSAIEIYFEDRWYNVWHFREHTTASNLWYANVSMPAQLEGETIRWVDLDIDIRCYLDGSVEVIDEDEFDQNRVKMRYPDHVVERALSARDEVMRLAHGGRFPFDHEAQLAALDR